jgi:hypothetical protein
MCHDPTRTPGSLKVKTSGERINVEKFTCQVQTWYLATLHAGEVNGFARNTS